MRNKIICLLFVLGVAGCSKDDIAPYDMTAGRVCFPGATSDEVKQFPGYSAADSTFYTAITFKKLPQGTTVGQISVPVKLIGGASEVDRQIGFRVLEKGTTAEASTYKVVSATVPAGKTYGAITFEVYKDEFLDANQRTVVLELVDSPDLAQGISIYLKANVTWHNMLLRPILSKVCTTYNMFIASPLTSSSTSLDAYSQAAHQLLLDAFGWEDIPEWSSQYSNYVAAYRIKANAYYSAWKAANPDKKIIHETGTLKGQEVEIRLK